MNKRIMLALLIVFVAVFGGGPVFADIIGTTSNDIFNIGKPKLSEQIEAVDKAKTVNIGSDTILAGVATIIGKLGTLEGIAYDFKQKEFINQVGATLYTYTNAEKPYLNIAVDLLLLNTTGAGGALDYNLGSVLPVKNIPIIQYFQYLHINAGGGYDFEENDERITTGALFKCSF